MKQETQKKLGRPPVGKRAMTSAERQKRYRDRIKMDAHKLLSQVKDLV